MKMKINNFFTVSALILALFIPAFAQDTKDDADSFYKLGRVYYDQGRYKEAEELFQKAVNILSRIEEAKKAPAKKAETVVPAEESPRQAARPAVQFPPATGARVTAISYKQEYVIGDEDVLHISVWQNPDLDSEAIVRPDGMISVPLVGDIQVTGITISQLTRMMTEKLAEFVRDPQVSVSIRKIGGKRVIILGQVATQGVINVGGSMKIMDAIGLAGGFTRDAVPSSTIVIRGGFTGAKAIKLNLSKIFKGDLKDNIDVQSQDIIFVPRKFVSDLSYFLDQVLTPLSRGAYFSKEVQTW
jgi:polysaccharide biosynthesis/export protein